MKVALLYFNFLDRNGRRSIGGVQTYLWHLTKLIVERGDEPVLFQSAKKQFEEQVGHLKVIGVEHNRRRLRRNTRRDLYERGLSFVARTGGLIIFGADLASVPTRYPRALSIQHGVGWDLPGRFLRGRFRRVPLISDGVCKRYIAFVNRMYFNNCQNRVCVDYNFLNWYRTQVPDTPKGNIWVIPNFVDIPPGFTPDLSRHERNPVKLLFARRFVEQRGTRLMIEAARRLLNQFQDVEICFAGEGPDERLIAEAFQHDVRVTIRKYTPDESLRVHDAFHIAVVPSLASEGTSLSLAEAMAAGCSVVASSVGGMTNMVIDGYNGRLVNPNVNDLANTLASLIRDQGARLMLGQRAAETARLAFSLERWKIRWSEVLDAVQS